VNLAISRQLDVARLRLVGKRRNRKINGNGKLAETDFHTVSQESQITTIFWNNFIKTSQ